MRQTHAYHTYKVDLTKIEGDGDFTCPKCGVTISPDDECEEAYAILGSKADNGGLEEMVIRCNKCSSQIHLTGFSLLNFSDSDEVTSRNSEEESTHYISHV
jgi:predicted RNA-binding Zn-ribbon protein involved in translation (DUF1610 family)